MVSRYFTKFHFVLLCYRISIIGTLNTCPRKPYFWTSTQR